MLCYEMLPQGALQGRARTALQLVFTLKLADYFKRFLVNSNGAAKLWRQTTLKQKPPLYGDVRVIDACHCQ